MPGSQKSKAQLITELTAALERATRLEETLRETEERFHAVADYTHTWEYWIGPDGRLIWMSPSCQRITGYSAQEFMESPELLLNIVLPEDRSLMERHLKHQRDGCSTQFLELRIRTRDGKIRWLAHSCEAVYDKQGKWAGRRASNIDITRRKRGEEVIRKSEERYRRIVETALEGIWVLDKDSATTFVNPRMADMLGYTPEEMLGRKVTEFIRPDQLPDHEYKALVRKFDVKETYERCFVKRDGADLWTMLSPRAIYDEKGEYAGAFAMITDITERKRAEETLRELEKAYRELVDFAPIGIFKSSPKGHYLTANTSLAEMLGYDSVQDLMESVQDIASLYVEPDERQEILRAAEQGAENMVEVRRRRKDGSVIWTALSMRAVRDQEGKILHYEGFTHDITERKRMEEKLKELATQDSLTGLNNRGNTLELGGALFDIAKRYGSSLAVAMFDIDQFKSVNDTRGHEAGDVVLKTLSRIALATFRAADVVGRLGGEEFAVVMPETDHAEAMNALERFRQTVESAVIPYEGSPLSVTVSCGLALLTPADDALDGLFKKADEALYRAKREGRNRVAAYADPLKDLGL